MPIRMASHNPEARPSFNKEAIRLKIISKKKEQKTRQIVNSEDANNNNLSKDSYFLGKKNQTFDQQTKSSAIGSFKKTGEGVKTGFKVSQFKRNIKETQKKQKKLKQVKKIKSSMNKKTKVKKRIKMSDLAMDGQKHLNRQLRPPPQLAALGLKNGSKTTYGLSASNDFVEDLPLGDMTHLNTKEYKYFGFFDRIRKKLEQYWGDSLKAKSRSMFSRGVRLPASENKITSLKVVLDSFGNIVDVLVKSTSGISELDEAAIESFNKAGPFPNPPKGMIINGRAEIEWGFVVKS